MTDVIDTIAGYILVSLLIPNVIFAARYFLYSPYERTREGRNLLGQKLAISSLTIVFALSIFLGSDYPGRPIVRLIAFTAVTTFYWIETVQLIKVQHEFPYRRFARKK